MKHPVHEYKSDTYESLSVVASYTLSLSLSLSLLVTGRQAETRWEKRKYGPPTVVEPRHRVGADPKPGRIRPRLRSRLPKKGHLGPLTDAFAGAEDPRDITERNESDYRARQEDPRKRL